MARRDSTALRTSFAVAVMLTAAVFWGMNAIASKLLYRDAHFDAMGLLAARGVWTAPLFACMAWIARPERLPGPAEWRRLFALGFAYGPLACGGLALGAQYTSGAHVSLLLSLSPPATAVVGALLLRERVERLRIAALALGLAGAGLLAFGKSSAGSSTFGDLLMLIQVAGFTGLFVLTRSLGTRYGSLFLTGVYGTLGMLGIGIIGLAAGGAATVPRTLADPVTAFWFFVEIVFGLSIYGQFAQTFALRRLGAGTVSVIASYGSLIVGVIGAVALLHEHVGATGTIAGGALALALGLALVPVRPPQTGPGAL